jgi:hypothetical protein
MQRISEDHHQGSHAEGGGGQAQAKIVEEKARQLGAPQPVGPTRTTGHTRLARRHPTPPVIPVSHTSQIGP